MYVGILQFVTELIPGNDNKFGSENTWLRGMCGHFQAKALC